VKFVDEFRDAEAARRLSDRIAARATRRWRVMEVCGGQTHAILAHGIDEQVSPAIELLHGPGCPVCVTPVETLDRAMQIAAEGGAALCSFGDMLRVPGSSGDLLAARARGADVRVVYSPLDAARLAAAQPGRRFVFLAVGFETTAPAVALAVRWAHAADLRNFSVLAAHVRVPPALEAICAAPDSAVDAFLAAGHVCTVMGTREYEPIARRFARPIVATGFEPLDILQGLEMALEQLEQRRAQVEIQYARAVRAEGNTRARALLDEVFEVVDRPWRGVGLVRGGGLGLRARYARFDAERIFTGLGAVGARESSRCRAGEVLRGAIRPDRCPEFGRGCTPERPLGAPMVSSEGACAAYFHYRPIQEVA